MCELRAKRRRSRRWFRPGLSFAVRSAFLGAFLGGVMGAVVASFGPGHCGDCFGEMARDWAISGALVGAAMGLLASLIGTIYGITRDAAPDGDPQQLKSLVRIRRSRRFFRVYWASLPIAAGLSLFAFWQSFHTRIIFDYDEYVGWPMDFYNRGIGGGYHFDSLAIDVVIWLVLGVLAGLVARFGIYRLSIKTYQLLRGRMSPAITRTAIPPPEP